MKSSELARPPVTAAEAERADHAICRIHGGHVTEPWAHEGRVFYCPLGREFWRYTRTPRDGFHAPIHYPKSGVL